MMAGPVAPPDPRPASEEKQEPLPRIFGRYLLLDRISRGGMGDIFLARHGLAGYEKVLVIKKIRPGLVADRGFASRFEDEAQLAVNLQHANIAQVFEVGRKTSEFFLALEYIDGRDLRRILRKLDSIGGRLPEDIALFVIREVLSGLAYAHRRKDTEGDLLDIVHCDISPPNVMISFEGEIKIIDFGIARSALKATSTDPKMGWGKFGYMAPEQLVAGQSIDYRSDLYAVGVLLFEMLTGQRMYPAGDPPNYRELARRVTQGDHPVPSEVDANLGKYDAIVRHSLAPKADDRYQSAAEFRDEIQRALVAVRATTSSDDVGLFVRHLFAEERIAWRRRLTGLMSQSDSQKWRKKLESGEPTVTFAMGDRFASVKSLPTIRRDPDTTEVADRPRVRALLLPGIVAAVLVLVFLISALLVRGMRKDSADQKRPTAPDPSPIVDSLPNEGVTPETPENKN